MTGSVAVREDKTYDCCPDVNYPRIKLTLNLTRQTAAPNFCLRV